MRFRLLLSPSPQYKIIFVSYNFLCIHLFDVQFLLLTVPQPVLPWISYTRYMLLLPDGTLVEKGYDDLIFLNNFIESGGGLFINLE